MGLKQWLICFQVWEVITSLANFTDKMIRTLHLCTVYTVTGLIQFNTKRFLSSEFHLELLCRSDIMGIGNRSYGKSDIAKRFTALNSCRYFYIPNFWAKIIIFWDSNLFDTQAGVLVVLHSKPFHK